VRARTVGMPVACPGCGTQTARAHGYHERMAADVPIDGRRLLVRVWIRRMRGPGTTFPPSRIAQRDRAGSLLRQSLLAILRR
jgi:hypothetical protein